MDGNQVGVANKINDTEARKNSGNQARLSRNLKRVKIKVISKFAFIHVSQMAIKFIRKDSCCEMVCP